MEINLFNFYYVGQLFKMIPVLLRLLLNSTDAQRMAFSKPPEYHQKAISFSFDIISFCILAIGLNLGIRKSSGVLFEMYASSGQNNQFGRLTEELFPHPTFFMDFFLYLCCKVLTKLDLKLSEAIFGKVGLRLSENACEFFFFLTF